MKITTDIINDNLKLCEKARNSWISRSEKNWRLVYEQEPELSEIGSGTLKYNTKENRIHAKLLDWRSVLLKNKPTFRVQATKPDDMDLSDSVTAVAYKKWKTIGAHDAISKSQLETGYAGLSILRYNRIETRPNVYVEKIINIPRGDFWHDPQALEIGEGWCCYRTWNSVENLHSWFSKRKVDITINDAQKPDPMPVYREQRDLTPSFTNPTEPPEAWGDELFPLYEFWAPPAMTEQDDWKVFYMLEDKILLELDNPYRQVVQEKQRTLDETGENVETPEIVVGHGNPPFVSHRCYWKPDQNGYIGFYSVEGIAEHLETVQYDLTETSKALMIMTRRSAQPPSMEEENSLVNDVLNLEPSARNTYRITKTPPVLLDEGLNSSAPVNTYQFKKDALNELSGIRDFMTGEQPQGTSGTPTGTVMFAQEASFIRMPDIVQQLDKTILSLGKLILGNMQQFSEPGEFIDVTIGGQPHWVEWSQKHLETEFNLEVVSGMTTILRDIDRQQNSTNIFTQVSMALQTQSISVIKTTKQWLLSMDEPAGYGYIPILDEEIAILEQATQIQAQLGGMNGETVEQI